MRHFSLRNAPVAARPALLIEVEIDFQDVRSGARVADHAFFAAEWVQGAEQLGWTEGMVHRVAEEDLTTCEPPGPAAWPEHADQSLIDYLLSHYHVELWRNPALGLFSRLQETEQEFLETCREAVRAERGQELRRLSEMLLHRVVDLESRALRSIEAEGWEDKLASRTRNQVKGCFSQIREEVSGWFVSDEPSVSTISPADWELSALPGIQDRLHELKRYWVSTGEDIERRYEARVGEIEPYAVRLPASALRLVSRNILWSSASLEI